MDPIAPLPVDMGRLFDCLAPRYERINHLLSLGFDLYWRWRLAKCVCRQRPRRLLDLATGSGEVIRSLLRARAVTGEIVGIDLSKEMLQEAHRKGVSNVYLGNAEELPFADQSFEAVTVAFGLRNFYRRDRVLQEVKRVLVPGGRFYILEFSLPYPCLRSVYFAYIETLGPWLAKKHGLPPEPYHYLARSIRGFLSARQLARLLVEHGFEAVGFRRFTGGIACLHWATKPTAVFGSEHRAVWKDAGPARCGG
ncbi:ubiquinone/menaquinone biosynthesis methyltransferase [Candidatus Methylacidithermus pantelleriae]|uniref:Demethylmenaquinone methyltransferase n=1 Tax=Candidatus Methylacidithermus pantelleriae TaxID=2744239 RepID=A0A8J2BLX9_9BACT|nr:ubiquinone/menaquinone biosynthesis methyltransferase [Candidatus Methylacidithermus pantelleriae]CAF0694649.1 Demethylmenaquinone methyltransferase [Candidatus Methylacidithermus pantelleriae]